MIQKMGEIRKSLLCVKYYLSLFSLKIPLFCKEFMTKSRIRYRLFFKIPFWFAKNQAEVGVDYVKFISKNYIKIIHRIRERQVNGEPIRVAFLVVMYASFAARGIFEAMLKDKNFAPFIVIVPNYPIEHNGHKEQIIMDMQTSYDSLCEIYKGHQDKIISSYNHHSDSYLDFSKQCDVVYFANAYEINNFYSITYLSQFALSIYMCYGYSGYFNMDIKYVYPTIAYSLLWNIYVENQSGYELVKSHQMVDVGNLSLVGYPKMDLLKESLEAAENKQSKKKIIIAPHHTVANNIIRLSNFPRLADFFLKLPILFPQIDFIFRPHPLLFRNLIRDKIYDSTGGGGGLNAL